MLEKTRRIRILTVSYIYQNDKPVPIIRLQGKWLRKLGFEQDNKIKVVARKGVVLIRLIPDEATTGLED
jgi:hypothetical protein